MASQVTNNFLRGLMSGEFDLHSSGDDIRLRLVMTNTTCDTEIDAISNISDYSTLDTMDGANYTDKELSSEAVTADDTNDRAEFDAADVTWTALGAGTRAMQGVLVYKYVDGTDGNDIPLAFIEFSSNVTADGSDFQIQWNSEGIFQIAKA